MCWSSLFSSIKCVIPPVVFQVGDRCVLDRTCVFACVWLRYIDSMCATVEDVWVWSVWWGQSSPRRTARDGAALAHPVPYGPRSFSSVQRPSAASRAHRSDITQYTPSLYLCVCLHGVYTAQLHLHKFTIIVKIMYLLIDKCGKRVSEAHICS